MTDEPKIPRGVQMMIRNIIGVDPDFVVKSIQEMLHRFRDGTAALENAIAVNNRQMAQMTEQLATIRADLNRLLQEQAHAGRSFPIGNDGNRCAAGETTNVNGAEG